MAKMTILRGISGSGKSTWARQQNAVVISRDSIRHETIGIPPEQWWGSDVSKDMLSDREAKVTRLHDAMVAALLKGGNDVIVDNTHIEWKFVKAMAKIAYRYGAEVEVKVFDVRVEVAIAADKHRRDKGGRYVGEAVIRKQHERFKANKSMQLEPVFAPKPYSGTPGKPEAFLVDIDGTLAHMRDYRGPFDWHKVGLDDVDEVIAGIADALWASGLTTIVMSGRDESSRLDTQAWLAKHHVEYQHLFMRPQGDMRPDNIVKAELFDKHVRENYDVQFVLDDRDQVVDMWRAMGLTCLQVAPGDF